MADETPTTETPLESNSAAAVTALRNAPAADDPWADLSPEAIAEAGGATVDDSAGDPWAEPAAAEPAAAAGDAPAAGEGEGEEGEEEGDEGAAGAAAADTPLSAPVTLKLPRAGDDETPLEIDTDDPEVVASFNDLIARAGEAESAITTAQEEANRALAERDEFLLNLRADPATTIARALATVESRTAFALQLLQDDALRAAVLPKLEEWDADPTKKALAAAEYRENITRRRDAARQDVQAEQFGRQWRNAAMREVAALIPRGIAPAMRETLYADAVSDLQRAINANNGEYPVGADGRFDGSLIRAALEQRVQLWRGIAPARGTKAGTTVAKPAAAATPATPAKAKPAPAPSAAELAAARAKPAAVQKATLRRRTLAASAPGTRANTPAGAAPAADVSNMNVNQVIAHLRGQTPAK